MTKILVVEDEKDIREPLVDILEMSGYQTLQAENGKTGLARILESQPDLVICDVNMPEMDGFELLESLNKTISASKVPPFIFLTAKVQQQDLRAGMNLGADDYITKPFDHMALLEIVKMRLEKRKQLVSTSSVGEFVPSSGDFNKIALPNSEGLDFYSFDDIIRVEADRSYCTFFMEKGVEVLVSKSMKEYEDLLVEKGFLKIHKSTIVNLKHIKQYIRGKGGQVRMSDGSVVSVSLRRKELLMEKIQNQ